MNRFFMHSHTPRHALIRFFSEFGTPVQIRFVEHPRTVGKKVSGRRKSPDMAVYFSA